MEIKTHPDAKNYDLFSSKSSLQEKQAFVIEQFLQFYKERGYQLIEPENLIPKDDKSVIFTGATITPLKKYLLREGIPYPGLYMVQKCLRTKRLDDMTDLKIIPDWTHYFTMCGVLSTVGREMEVANEAYDLLVNKLKIPKSNFLVDACLTDRDLSRHWQVKGIEIAENTHQENIYRWRYGIPNIYGRGINLLLRYNETDVYRDLGNMISVEDSDGKTLGYEFGCGLESLISKMLGFKKPLEASLVSAVIPYKEGLQEKFIDLLTAVVVILHYDIEPGRGREKHVLKRLIKGLSYLRRKMDISIEQVKEWCLIFEKIEFGESNSVDKIIVAISTYEDQLEKYIDYAKNQVYAHKLRNEINGRLREKLEREGNNMGILPNEVVVIIETVLS